MKCRMFLLVCSVLLLALIRDVRTASAANAVVGTGNPASCTEAAFDSALTAANSGGGTITFNCGAAAKTIVFTALKVVTLGDVTIDGKNRIVLEAANNERHFFAGSGVTFQLRNITLRDGNSLVSGGAVEASGADVILNNVQMLNNSAAVTGGAIYCYDGALSIFNSLFERNTAPNNGGAIYNDGCTLTIAASTFRGNQARDGGGLYLAVGSNAVLDAVSFTANDGGYGGGLENSGVVTVTNSIFEGNTVTGSGGGIWNLGGTVILERTTVRNNQAYEGGGVNSYGNHVEMTDVNIVGNVATGTHGGGLYHGGGTVFVTNATISGNMASDSAANGGGVYQNSDDNLVMTNVTLTNNQAGALGGGFYHYGRYAILTNVTIADNLAGAAGDALYEDSPMTPENPGVIQLVNSALLGSANNCDGALFQSLGHNISRGTCASLSASTDQDNFSGNLRLGPLAFNGGAFPMETRLPQAGSPLINAADAANCTAHDQRGGARAGVCDIGAVEYGASVPGLLYMPTLMRP